MNTKNSLKPPNLNKVEVVCFHYNPMENKNRITLQVPNNDFSEANTFYLYLDSAEDTSYILQQKNGLRLLDILKMYGHVLYKNGDCSPLEIENDTASSRHNPFATFIAGRSAETRRWKSESNWKVSALWCRKQK